MGKAIIEHQAVAFMLADMAISADAARGLVWQAAWLKDHGERNSKIWPANYADDQRLKRRWLKPSHPELQWRMRIWACKVSTQPSRLGKSCAVPEQTVYGGAGFNTEMPMEKLYRDAKIYELCEPNVPAPGRRKQQSDGPDEGTSQIQRLIVSRQLKDLYPA